ncbi:LapA family protein [Trinickia fusca]|uniref:LapA family protein n=1 Tax=Trinickia fusca TaxID=2419777 RepID=A0A494XN38_9BURK|nr:LapA family protein [Trinickia fusca]RKP52090.1 LapA family protein [Trinickia fusca]
MKFIVWLIRVLVFVLLLVLALDNMHSATLNLLTHPWQAPLILIGLAFFGVGLLAGLVSALPSLVRLKLENGRLRRDLRTARETPAVTVEPPMPPIV